MAVVVIVGPSALERDALEHILGREGYATMTANGPDALPPLLAEADPALVVVDVAPSCPADVPPTDPQPQAAPADPWDLRPLHMSRQHPRWWSLPVVVLADHWDPAAVREAEGLGAMDCLLKAGLTWSDLLSRVRFYTSESAAAYPTVPHARLDDFPDRDASTMN